MLRVLIADDHSVVRAGLRALLESHEDIEVVVEVDSGEAAVRQAKAHQPDDGDPGLGNAPRRSTRQEGGFGPERFGKRASAFSLCLGVLDRTMDW